MQTMRKTKSAGLWTQNKLARAKGVQKEEANIGIGDDIMATGMARGAHARGKRIAFGDGKRIIWGPNSAEIFAGNPNIAPPGCEYRPDIEWIHYHKGHRIYNRLDQSKQRWIWNYEYRATPGEVYFGPTAFPSNEGMVVIEPNVPQNKSVAANKQWPLERYQAVADALVAKGFDLIQPDYLGAAHKLRGVRLVKTRCFRDALSLLRQAWLYIGPEGGLHHGAAAVDCPAVVLFGGFIPPEVTGYDTHFNLTGDSTRACGSLSPCQHCKAAMNAITVDEVISMAEGILDDA